MDVVSSFEHYYKRGIAVGMPDIRTDAIVFFWRGEEISLPTIAVLGKPPVAKSNGTFYTAPLKKLREIAKEL